MRQDRTTVAIDYGAPGRAKSFEVMQERYPSWNLARIAPPGIEPGLMPELNVGAYSEYYRKQTAALGPPPYTLLGYCAGGRFALTAAGLLTQAGHEVDHVLLFDSFPAGGDLAGQFVDTMRGLGWSEESNLDLDLIAQAQTIQRHITQGEPGAAVDCAEEFSFEFSHRLLASRGLPLDRQRRLAHISSQRWVPWFRYIAASSTAYRSSASVTTSILCSKTEFEALKQAWSGDLVSLYAFDCTTDGLLSEQEPADLTALLMSR